MATKHTFLTVGGKWKTSTLTPIKAIRENCVHCVQSIYSVADCGGETCALYPFRLGDAHTVSEEQRERLSVRAKASAGR